jgi:hypothetical protein
MAMNVERLGNANVVVPLPPYVVPITANKALLLLMGNITPLQDAHPDGANLQANILISPR